MEFLWVDYRSGDAELIDSWLDDTAVAMTGIDSGWEKYWQEVIADAVNYSGCEDRCKLVKRDGIPVAAIVFGCYRGVVTISEIVVAPFMRAKGFGTQIIRELVMNANCWFQDGIDQFRAVVFPDNLASKKAFQNAGFVANAATDGTVLEYQYTVRT